MFKKNLNAFKPSEHPPSGEKMSKGLGGNIDCKYKITSWHLNGSPNVTTSGQQYNTGEKPSVILYTYVNLHAGTPKPQSFLSVWEFRTTVVVIWSYMVLEKLDNFTNISL